MTDLARINETLARRAELIDNGGAEQRNGNLIATTGWDRGEVIGRDGLATQANGNTALWLNGEPAWHRLGKVYDPAVDGELTIDDILTDAGLDYNVVKLPLFAGLTDESKIGTIGLVGVVSKPYALVRDDTMTPLGVAGRVYTPFQNRQAMSFLQELTGQGDLSYFASAGQLSRGAMVFVSMRLGEDVVIGKGEADDHIQRYAVVTNRHDADGGINVSVNPLRPVCTNTLRWGAEMAQASFTMRHVPGSIEERAAAARRMMEISNKFYDQLTREGNELYQTPMSNGEFDRFLAEVAYPVDQDSKEFVQKRQEDKQTVARELFRNAPTQANIRGTRYAAAQALIEQIDHRPASAAKSLRLEINTPKSLSDEIARGARVIKGDDDERKSNLRRALLTWRR